MSLQAALQSADVLSFQRKAGAHFDRSALLGALRSHRLPENLIQGLLADAAVYGSAEMRFALERALGKRMRAAPIVFSRERALLLIGPHGAGKTAVAAKIAARARDLGRHVDCVAADTGIADVMAALPRRRVMTIIDGAGINPRNAKARAAFAAIAGHAGIAAIGVLSALSDAEEVGEIAAALPVDRLVVTGLDLARRAGALAAAACSGIALAHVTRGEDAPLEPLTAKSLAAMLSAPALAN